MEKQKLPVGDQVPTGIPVDGLEYLAYVRAEADKIPFYMVASKSTQPKRQESILVDHQLAFQDNRIINPIADEHLPTRQWLRSTLESFHGLKRKLSLVGKPKNTEKLAGTWTGLLNITPKLSHIAQLSPVHCFEMIEHFTTHTDYTLLDLQWIYGLLVRCDLLLEADDIHRLRELAKALRTIRTTEDHDKFVATTLAIAIVSEAFGQKDLADNYR